MTKDREQKNKQNPHKISFTSGEGVDETTFSLESRSDLMDTLTDDERDSLESIFGMLGGIILGTLASRDNLSTAGHSVIDAFNLLADQLAGVTLVLLDINLREASKKDSRLH